MNKRILIISNARPSRTWNFANRILREVPGIEICGIVQRSIGSLPWVQQMIAAGKTRIAHPTPSWAAKAQSLIRFMADKVVDWLLWLVHGSPSPLNNPKRLTMERLRQECSKAGWPLAIAAQGEEARAVTSICLSDVSLVILLGEFSSVPELPVHTSNGCIRGRTYKGNNNANGSSNDVLIHIEQLVAGAGASFTIFTQVLPWQPFDGTLGFSLKADLITDDLLLQTAAALLSGGRGSASTVVSEWANRILAPSLSRPTGVLPDTFKTARYGKRSRSTWKLCLDSLLLCSPGILCRNWYRRIVGRYPVLILAHHLVSDRPHRMGVSTEVFWRQVLFLQKHYRIVNLAESARLQRLGQINVPTVVLTFDDGYADNFLNLRAVANEVRIPSTLFITTEPVEARREFDHDLAAGVRGFFPLTWEQIQYWSSCGTEFGSHTRTHFDCGSTDLETLRSEIIGSKNELEAHLKRPVNFFAFPFGKPENMSAEAKHLAASAYKHYVSTFGGESLPQVGKLPSHLLRKAFYGNLWELELELQSVFDAVDSIKRCLYPQAIRPPTHSRRLPAVQ